MNANQKTLEAMEKQAFKTCSLVNAARMIADNFRVAEEEQWAVAEVLRQAVREAANLHALILEAIEAAKVKPAAA